MVQVPQDEVTLADLATWYTMADQLRKLKASEMLLRQRLFGHFFPNPTEGTNTFVLPDAHQLKAKYPITRDVDEGAYRAMNAKQLEIGKSQFEQHGINGDALVTWKPSLVLSVYRQHTEEEQKFIDRCLLVKPGSPSLEIAPPAKPKKGAAAA